MAKKPVKIMETILRDAHQSQSATRMRRTDMLPAAEMLDKIGYYALEAWGGATFDSCIRFLDEDPWERLVKLREAIPNTNLQMLLRGQNLLGYRHYSDDVVKAFVDLTVKNGIDILRIFDALNDINNLKTAIEATKEAKSRYGRGTVEAALSYTTGPVYDNAYYVGKAKELKAMGADIICIKDMANLLKPYAAYDLVSALKDAVDMPVHIHTHNTAGIGDMTNLKAIEAGADIVDTALSPLGNGTSQPATESLVATLQGTEYDTGIDLKKLNELTVYFRTVAERLKKAGFLSEKVLKVDVNALIYQVPGGMLSNLINQLKEQGKSEKLEEVLAEVPNVRADLGYPPLVTPSSQIVGTQAVLNVLMGERYKMVTKETKGIVRGEYGKLPVEPKPEAVKKILGGEKPIKYSPHDLPPELDKLRKELGKFYEKEEDVLTYALFPQVSIPFFEKRYARNHGVDVGMYGREDGVHPV